MIFYVVLYYINFKILIMSVNIINLIKEQISSTLVSESASQLKESEAGVSKAISGLIPVVLGSLANNSNNQTVIDAVQNSTSSDVLGNLLNNTSNNSFISGLLSSLFGDKISGIVNTIATYAGISNNSSSSLLSLVTGATLGSINKYASSNNLDRSGISSLLSDQKGIVSSLLPAGLSLASLNIGDWAKKYEFGNDGDKVNPTVHEEPKIEVTRSISNDGTNPNRNTSSEGGSIWKWLLPLLLLIAAAYFIWKQCEKKETTVTTVNNDSLTTSEDTSTTTLDTPTATTTKVDEDIDLNGVNLKGYRGGMEDRMIAFLKSDGYKNAANDDALKNNWYDFDHVNFKIGSATELEKGSEGQLQNLVAILKAFPDAKIKIGGYTDKTGDEAKNLKLSADRANFIKDWLTKQSVGAQVTGADGYGSEFAKVDQSASNDERAIDRKMSVRFAK